MGISFGSEKKKQSANQASTVKPYEPTIPYVNSYLEDIGQLQAGGDAQTAQSTARVTGNFDDFTRRITPTAEGQNLDINNNPYIAEMLSMTADDAQNRINAQFAGAGRDLSGINQQSVARGVTQAQLPVLADQYNKEQGRTDTAIRDALQTSVQVDEYLRGLPFDVQERIKSLLLPAAGLGQQNTGTSSGTSKGSAFGTKADLGTAFGSLFS